MIDYEILDRFHSKRNLVCLVRLINGGSGLAVLKKYRGSDNVLLDMEYDNIQRLRAAGAAVPRILCTGNDSLLLEYIEGELAADLAEKLDTGAWIEALALWLAKLHSIREGKGSVLKGDVNLRNFLYRDGQIYGLDFENMTHGDPRTDLGNLCFFILTNSPAFGREKHMMVRRLLRSYESFSGTKLEAMGSYLLQSRTEARIRRTQSRKDILR